jgi:flagellar protein FlgJ
MSIGRIPSTGAVNRDTASQGHEQLEKSEQLQAKRNPQVDQVAKMYEKQFLQEMFKAMRSTVKPSEEPSMAQHIYQDQLDDQYIDAWGDNGGIGLSNIIYDQVMEKYFGAQTTQDFRKQGPVALTDRDVARVSRVGKPGGGEQTRGGQVPLNIEVKPSATGGSAKIQAPWDAEVVQSTKLEGGKTAITLQHGEGIRSTLIFEGVPSTDAQPGKKIAQGQTVGVLSPEAKSFLWNLNQPASSKGPASGEKVGTGTSQYDTL